MPHWCPGQLVRMFPITISKLLSTSLLLSCLVTALRGEHSWRRAALDPGGRRRRFSLDMSTCNWDACIHKDLQQQAVNISRKFVELHVPGDPEQCVDPETGLAHPLNTPWAPAPCQHSTCITFSTTDTQILEERCLHYLDISI